MKKLAIVLTGLALFVFFYGLGDYALIEPDEGRYSEIAREMLETGDFVTPKLNHVKYFEKPVLHYWLTALSFAVFGFDEAAARLTPVLFALGGAWIVFTTARRMWGAGLREGVRKEGVRAGLKEDLRDGSLREGSLRKGSKEGLYGATILSSCLLWFAIARLNILDMTVTFFITLAMAGFWRGCAEDGEVEDREVEDREVEDGEAEGKREEGKREERKRGRENSRRYLFLFYGGMALATLSKGLIGVVLPGGIAFFYILATRQWRLVLRSLYWPGIVLFFLLTVPWFWAVCHVNSDFFHYFFIQEHLLRYTTRIHDRYQPFWYFIPILVGGLIPWAGLLPDILRDLFFAWKSLAWKSGTKARVKAGVKAWTENEKSSFIENEKSSFPDIFLGIWFALPFVFFSLSSSKLIPYILPSLPPLAILGGKALALVANGDGARGKRFAFLNGGVLTLPAMAGVVYPLMDTELGTAALYPYTLPAAASLLTLALCGWLCCFKRIYSKMVSVLCVLAFVNLAIFARGFVLKAELDSYETQAALIEEILKPDDVVVAYKETAQGLGFYLRRRIALVDMLGELEFGACQEKDPRWFIDSQSLKALWDGEKRVFLVSSEEHLDELTRLLGESNVIQWNSARITVILSNF
ncbi:MAG: glycosyltransferase family 39 protein [Synergistaceae bacterium]|nr:glycosyltransferase family 39 protein [Synergistaceae bacterium]